MEVYQREIEMRKNNSAIPVSSEREEEIFGISEMLPPNWVSIELSKVVIYGKGKKPKVLSPEQKNGLVPYIDIKAFEKGIIDEYADTKSSRIIDEKDILVVWDGARFGLTGMGKSGAAGSTLMVLKPILCHPRYIYRFINRYYGSINSKPKGSGTPHVNPEIFWNLPFPIAPLNEQKRIVTKLDAILPRIESVKARLDKIPVILKRFRQSVLSAAVTGKLTEKWREEHPETGEWEKVELQSVIPEGNIFDGPFGSNLKTRDYSDFGVRVIRLENIEYLKFLNDKETYITKEKYLTLKRHTVSEGDIIFSSFISDKIRACILPRLPTKAIAKADCFCIRPDNEIINVKYLLFSLVSYESYDQLVVNIHGATRPRINTTQLKKLIIQYPPIKEQKIIVEQVEILFAVADKVEAHYQNAKVYVEKLSQSILVKAFRGELVPQDPNDEPAEKLLERIFEEKAKMEAELKMVRKKSSAKKVAITKRRSK
jgi:type I restriction enzyme, S subunit